MLDRDWGMGGSKAAPPAVYGITFSLSLCVCARVVVVMVVVVVVVVAAAVVVIVQGCAVTC